MIGFAVGRLKLPLQEVYDMSWAEFVLRSIGFKQEEEQRQRLFREVAYQGYRFPFVFGKKKPVSIDKFWQIGKQTKKKNLSDKHIEAFKTAYQDYLRGKK